MSNSQPTEGRKGTQSVVQTINGPLQDRYIAEELLKLNQESSIRFKQAKGQRQQCREEYPAEIAIITCMDGRTASVSTITDTPPGLHTVFQAAGARCRLESMPFNTAIRDLIDYAQSVDRPVLIICTYHWSAGKQLPEKAHDRGCAAFKKDTDMARAYVTVLAKQFNELFNGTNVYAIYAGIETDEDALMLHSVSSSDAILLSDFVGREEQAIQEVTRIYHSSLPPEVIHALQGTVVAGNLRHIADVRKTGRDIVDLDHREMGIYVGHNTDWIDRRNYVLGIGHWDLRQAAEEAKLAAGIVDYNNNHKEERNISVDVQPFLLVLIPVREPSIAEARLAIPIAAETFAVVDSAIRSERPELSETLAKGVGTISLHDRTITLL